MAISSITCDRCGDEIREHRAVLLVESGPLRRTHATSDLCVTCQRGFTEWFGQGKPTPAEVAVTGP